MHASCSLLCCGGLGKPELRGHRPFVRIERLRVAAVVDPPGVRHQGRRNGEPQASRQEELPSLWHELVVGVGSEERGGPHAQDAWNCSPKSSFHVVHGVPSVPDAEVEHQCQDHGVTQVPRLLPNQNRRRCAKRRDNQDPHDREENAWRRPAWHGAVAEAARGFSARCLSDVGPRVVQGREDARADAHQKEKPKHRPVRDAIRHSSNGGVQGCEEGSDRSDLDGHSAEVLRDGIAIHLLLNPCSSDDPLPSHGLRLEQAHFKRSPRWRD
mmetsp:Transcript_69529/g.166693  ORF Transcript_69529/g.166693 Transcript_69529/m.166693 type:complete len:269 (-) Transcript_69529:268-1074(-)